MGQGGGGMEETAHLFQAEESWEAVFGCCANEVECLPVASKGVAERSSWVVAVVS